MSIGRATIEFLIRNVILKIAVHIIDTDPLILLSLANIDVLWVHYNNLEDKLYHVPSGHTAKRLRKFDHPFLWWDSVNPRFFTEIELRRSHEIFGHPNADKLYNFLKRSELPDVDSKTRQLLENITCKCVQCKRYAQTPRRLMFHLRDDKDFNHTVLVDIFYIDGRSILHAVDEATRYEAARWLCTVSASFVRCALRLC